MNGVKKTVYKVREKEEKKLLDALYRESRKLLHKTLKKICTSQSDEDTNPCLQTGNSSNIADDNDEGGTKQVSSSY